MRKHSGPLGTAAALCGLFAAFLSLPSAEPAASCVTLLTGPVPPFRADVSRRALKPAVDVILPTQLASQALQRGARQPPHPEPQHKELTNRNEWQRPHWVMDVLGVKEGATVADVGAGSGYFTLHLAGRVGWSGRVYAVDIRADVLAGIREFRRALNLPQIETVLGDDDDPHLPSGTVDVVLVVNTYHEMHAYDRMMQAFLQALKPGGLLGIIDAEAAENSPRAVYFEDHRLPSALVRADAVRNGFRFVRTEPGFTNPDNGAKWYFLIFERPRPLGVAHLR